MNRQILVILILILSMDLMAQSGQRYWIYFKDKEPLDRSMQPALSDLAIAKKVNRNIAYDDISDMPVSLKYIRQLEMNGVRIYRQSRWLNAVSVIMQGSSIAEIEKYPFVSKVQPVKTFQFRKDLSAEASLLPKVNTENYGPSDNQVRMVGIPVLHDMGFHGQGVRIALFDTGFRLEHESLKHIQVIDTYDFINNDAVVDNEAGDHPNQYHHGTRVLSVIGGYDPGNLIGPAYQSEYLLAKTEDLTSETHLEEDNWVAAAEWADSLGADIISSSLGYSIFESGEGDYTYEDMNGNTTIITRAANIAVEKGIAVFTSAGNEGSGSWYHITAPADGFNVVSVGGLNPDGTLWSGSSRGPTSDGRIKPELVAQGASVFNADPLSINSYSVATGTSLSCPLAAGSGALILSINPNLNPLELRELLIVSASQSNDPDNDLGYGKVDLIKCFELLSSKPTVEISDFQVKTLNGRNLITWKVHMEISNGYWSVLRRQYQGKKEEIARLDGREFNLQMTKYEILDNKIMGGENFQYILSAQPGGIEQVDVDSVWVTTRFSDSFDLFSCYPNPFNNQTTITMSLTQPARISLLVFNISGQLIRSLIKDKYLDAGYHHFIWYGENDEGIPVSSSVYYITAGKGAEIRTQKVVLLK